MFTLVSYTVQAVPLYASSPSYENEDLVDVTPPDLRDGEKP